MIQVADRLWIGYSSDVEHGNLTGITALLNVAWDLKYHKFDPEHKEQERVVQACEYAQVGLVDGPGNLLSSYCSAVLTLRMLLDRHDGVLVYDHDGGRALVVTMMYLNLIEGKYRPDSLSWSHWLTWDERLVWIEERIKLKLSQRHKAHIEAFNKIPYGVLEALL